tara:strand:+ start:298 stop:765 length:468 start_codon:yes stop_codon:yes gene_type:complete
MATLSTTVIEEITLNGDKTRLVNTKAITGINNLYRRVVKLPASQTTTLCMFQTSEHTSDGALDLEDTRYIRITNLDTSNTVTLSLQVAANEDGSANTSASILLDAGKSFMLGTVHDGISVDDSGATVIVGLTDLESIAAVCGGSEVSLEVFVATL